MTKELEDYIDNSKAQHRKGILEFSVLLSMASHEMYATEIINKLRQFDLLVLEGTLYPILSRLRESGLVSYNWVESKEGPPRKYFSLTEKGKDILTHLISNYNNLHKSINQLISQS